MKQAEGVLLGTASEDRGGTTRSTMGEMIRNLDHAAQGHPVAADELLPLVYGELRKLAAAKLAREQPGQTLQATALVHEVWLKLAELQATAVARPGALLRSGGRGHAAHSD